MSAGEERGLCEATYHGHTCTLDARHASDHLCRSPHGDPLATWARGDADHHSHDWLDRPESDTRECLICGEERAG